MLRYFNFEPSFKPLWHRARDLFGSEIPVTWLEVDVPLYKSVIPVVR